MSAWIVDPGHIDVLVNAAAQFGTLDGADPRAVGQLLWRENHRSVNYRYGQRSRTPSYPLRTTEAPLHPIAVLKAIGCYEYQSCEHKGWDTSAAHRFVIKLEAAIAAQHPEQFAEGAYRDNPIYDRAPWGFARLEQAHASNYDFDAFEKANRPW
jgi:hypothetical protein